MVADGRVYVNVSDEAGGGQLLAYDAETGAELWRIDSYDLWETGSFAAPLAIAASGLAVNLIGNAWLVPSRGIEGAAIATLATELTVAIAAGLCVFVAGRGTGSSGRRIYWLAGPLLFLLARALSGWFLPV